MMAKRTPGVILGFHGMRWHRRHHPCYCCSGHRESAQTCTHDMVQSKTHTYIYSQCFCIGWARGAKRASFRPPKDTHTLLLKLSFFSLPWTRHYSYWGKRGGQFISDRQTVGRRRKSLLCTLNAELPKRIGSCPLHKWSHLFRKK